MNCGSSRPGAAAAEAADDASMPAHITSRLMSGAVFDNERGNCGEVGTDGGPARID